MSKLDFFFRPRSVAIVGASDRETSSGGAVLKNARASGYRGKIIPVNQKGGEVLGLEAKTSLRDVIPPADLAVIVVRPDLILEVVRDAAESGHKRLLILPGGFAEAGEAGKNRDAALRQLARDHDLKIAGPNCAGFVDLLDPDFPFASTFVREMPRGGPVAFISQSGAIAEHLVDKSHEMDVPFGAIVSVGNAMQLGVTEYLEHYGDDPRCNAIALYVESFGDLDRFQAVARRVVARKPVIALVGGRSQPGADAVRRHTAGTALDDAQLQRVLEHCGVLRATSMRHMLLASKALGAFPQGLGERILLLSNSGGPGVLTTDAACRAGFSMPELPPDMATALHALLPGEAAVANPLDLLADAREDRFAQTLELALQHGRDCYDAILMLHVVPFMVDAAPVVDRLAELARHSPLPLMHSMMGTLPRRREWSHQLGAVGVPLFDDSEEMAVAAAAAARYRHLRQRVQG